MDASIWQQELRIRKRGLENMNLHDVLSNAVRLYPRQIALKDIHTGHEWTYEELAHTCERLAGALTALGVRKAHRVAVVAENTPEHVMLLLACARIGAVFTPVNSLLAIDQMVELINDSGASVLCYSARFSAVLDRRGALAHIEHVIPIGDGQRQPFQQLLSKYSVIAGGAAVDPHEAVAPSDILYQMYTSGTTGKSKGAMVTHANVIAELSGLSYPLLPYTGDRVLIATPYFHGAAVMMTILALGHAGTCIVTEGLQPEELVRALAEQAVAFCFVVPGMIINMLRSGTPPAGGFSHLKALIYGAAPIPVHTQHEAIRFFGRKLVQIYGQTETVMSMTLLAAHEHSASPEDPDGRRFQSIGRQIFCCEVRVFDDDDKDVAPDEVGEVVVRGDNVMAGYHNMPEATASTLRDGWLRTGDLATVDARGYIYLRGRKKDLIICDGENVYPIQVEKVIDRYATVLESAVIGVPHAVDGEQVHAFVVPRPGERVTEAEIIEHCKQHLGGFQVPKSISIVASLPRNTGGKILKTELRKPFWKAS